MPRRRARRTNRRPQEERRLRVRGVRRGEPDTRKLSRAFIALVLARAEAEAQAEAQRHTAREQHGDGGQEEAGDGAG